MRRQLLEELHLYFENIGSGRSETEEYLFKGLQGELPYFHISSVHRDDLESCGFDISHVTDGQMETIAGKMADAYTGNNVFWIDLDIIADYAGVPMKPETWDKNYLIERIQDIIDEYGAFNTAEVEANASPSIHSSEGITVLAEYFCEDCVTAVTYNKDGAEIHTEFKPYKELEHNVLCAVYELCANWKARND